MQLAPCADAQRQFAAKSDFLQSGILSLPNAHATGVSKTCKQEVPMALEKRGLMRRRGEHAFAA